jgi:hypothetical protein
VIIYKGIKQKNKFNFVCFENSKGSIIEIPVSKEIARQFSICLERLEPSKEGVERNLEI